MEENYEKRFVSKDGKQRITIYREEYAENPRYMTYEPLHCEDWERNFSIMTKSESENKSQTCCGLIRCLLEQYGNRKAIIELLKANAKAEKHEEYENCLMWDNSRKEWILQSWVRGWTAHDGTKYPAHWCEEVSFCCCIKKITAYDVVSYLSDETIDILCDKKYFTDGVKIASYSFGYYGEISFYDHFSTDSEGIAYLEKNEFLKYSGCDENYWKDKTFKDIDWLHEELEAWGDNDVYGYVVEDAVTYKTTRECLSGNAEDEEYEETEWEEKGCNSCWGFYGELDKVLDYMFDNAGLKKEDFEEE